MLNADHVAEFDVCPDDGVARWKIMCARQIAF